MMVVRDYLGHALRDAGLVELRHFDGQRWMSGTFDRADLLRQTVAALADRGSLYTTLNRPDDGIEATNAMTARALGNADFAVRVRIVFDFDPVRPTDTPSTDAELQASRAQRDRLVAALSGLGWPVPAVATSGNGAHAVYRVRLPVNAETGEMFTLLYRGLAGDFSTAAVRFDKSVHNAGRIWRLYGTVNRKGTPTADRPHRPATVALPNRWDCVSPRLVAALAERYARMSRPAGDLPGLVRASTVSGYGDYTTLDVVAWFQSRGMYRRALGGGKHAVRCPWDAEHTTQAGSLDSSTAIWEGDAAANRWPTFRCLHAHCEERRLADVFALWGDADRYCARPFVRRAA